MKDEINLLPPAELVVRESGIYVARLGHFLRVLMAAVLLVVIAEAAALGVVLFTDRLLLAGEEQTEASNDLTASITSINQRLDGIRKWRDSTLIWTPQIPDIISELPSGVRLQLLSSHGDEEGAFIVQGSFTTREELLGFRRRLEALPWVEKVDAPLSNFETGDAAEFQFTVHRVIEGS